MIVARVYGEKLVAAEVALGSIEWNKAKLILILFHLGKTTLTGRVVDAKLLVAIYLSFIARNTLELVKQGVF